MPEEVVYTPPTDYDPSHDTPKEAQKETITERLLKYGTLINKRVLGLTSVGRTIYTVPQGKTFFLVYCCIDAQNFLISGNSMIGKIVIKISGSTAISSPFLVQVSTMGGDDFNSQSISFPIPVKIAFGQEIVVYKDQSGATNVDGSIQSYEIANEFLK